MINAGVGNSSISNGLGNIVASTGLARMFANANSDDIEFSPTKKAKVRTHDLKELFQKTCKNLRIK
tara:strand:+ start:105 stop:302 length:198 start_codon:yes stop_codon:yes gene_type:complete